MKEAVKMANSLSWCGFQLQVLSDNCKLTVIMKSGDIVVNVDGIELLVCCVRASQTCENLSLAEKWFYIYVLRLVRTCLWLKNGSIYMYYDL